MLRLILLLSLGVLPVRAADRTVVPLTGGEASYRVALSRGGETLAYVDPEGALRVVDTRTGLSRYAGWRIPGEHFISELSVSNDGAVVVFFASENQQLYRVNLKSRTQDPVPVISSGHALSDDGRYLMVKNPYLGMTLVRTSDLEELTLIAPSARRPTALVGAFSFLPQAFRELIISPAAHDPERRLQHLGLHKATQVAGNEEVGISEIIRRTFFSSHVNYPSRVLEVSADGRLVLTLGHSLAEIWDRFIPSAPLAFAVSALPGTRSRYEPIETATLSLDSPWFAVVYARGIFVLATADGSPVADFRESTADRGKFTPHAVAARFRGDELIVARAGKPFFTRYPISKGCTQAVPAQAE